MSGSYYGVVVEARFKDQAEEKAYNALKLIAGSDGWHFNGADHYFDEIDRQEAFPWNPNNGHNVDNPSDGWFIKTAKVTSDSGKELVNFFQRDIIGMDIATRHSFSYNGDSIYLDEKGLPIEPNDNRLNDEDYFIVPVRLHY